MEKEKKFSKKVNFDDVITVENVQVIGEIIAIKAMKVTMAYCGKELDNLYAGLIHDVFDYKPVDEPYSDGYDIASEAICFLCGHIGKKRNEIFKIEKSGKVLTISNMCFRVACRHIEKLRGTIYNTTSYCSLIDGTEPCYEMDEEIENNNEILDNLIECMNLTQGQLDTLNCYMAGMNFTEIAQFLAVNLSTVWRRRQQLQQLYTQRVASVNY